MTQAEAYNKMLQGHKVTNVYYSEGEYAFINDLGQIETEDGCNHGGKNGIFWSEIQAKLPQEWSIYEEPKIDEEHEELVILGEPGVGHSFSSPEPFIIRDSYKMSHTETYVNLSNQKKWYSHYDKRRKKRK